MYCDSASHVVTLSRMGERKVFRCSDASRCLIGLATSLKYEDLQGATVACCPRCVRLEMHFGGGLIALGSAQPTRGAPLARPMKSWSRELKRVSSKESRAFLVAQALLLLPAIGSAAICAGVTVYFEK